MPKHKIETLRAKVARLEGEIARDLYEELAILPKQFGFDSAGDFLSAVKKAALGAEGRILAAVGGTPAQQRRRRARITDATRALVRTLVQAGKTGAEIASQVKISLPSVQNIKKQLGLVRAAAKSPAKAGRPKKTAAKPAVPAKRRPAPKKRKAAPAPAAPATPEPPPAPPGVGSPPVGV